MEGRGMDHGMNESLLSPRPWPVTSLSRRQGEREREGRG